MSNEAKPSCLTREDIIRSLLNEWDIAVREKKYGELYLLVMFQSGRAKYASPYFKPTVLIEESKQLNN